MLLKWGHSRYPNHASLVEEGAQEAITKLWSGGHLDNEIRWLINRAIFYLRKYVHRQEFRGARGDIEMVALNLDVASRENDFRDDLPMPTLELSEPSQKILSIIFDAVTGNDGSDIIKKNGKLNLLAVSRLLGYSRNQVASAMKQIRQHEQEIIEAIYE